MIKRLWRALSDEPILRFGIFMQFAWQRVADRSLRGATWWSGFVRERRDCE
jgi:hypothetical protein